MLGQLLHLQSARGGRGSCCGISPTKLVLLLDSISNQEGASSGDLILSGLKFAITAEQVISSGTIAGSSLPISSILISGKQVACQDDLDRRLIAAELTNYFLVESSVFRASLPSFSYQVSQGLPALLKLIFFFFNCWIQRGGIASIFTIKITVIFFSFK